MAIGMMACGQRAKNPGKEGNLFVQPFLLGTFSLMAQCTTGNGRMTSRTARESYILKIKTSMTESVMSLYRAGRREVR